MKWYKNQVLASTHQDSQGEKFDLEFLKELYLSLEGKKTPLGHEHDMSKGYSGYFENPRIIEDENTKGEYFLIADVYCDDIELIKNLKGFSFSITTGLRSNSNKPEFGVYLPFPYYNDEVIIERFLKIDVPIKAGKWIKKEHDPAQIALIVSFTLFLLGPFWQYYFNKKIAPLLDKILDSGKLDKTLKYDFGIRCQDKNNNDFHVYFSSNKKDLSSLRPHLIKYGLRKVDLFIKDDKRSKEIGISLARLNYDSANKSYKISSIEYKNGQFKNFE
jgi:hypothetical protein